MATEIRELKKTSGEKDNAVLFSGLPGIGLVGKIAIDYLIKKLGPDKSAEIFSDSFYPSIVTEEGLIESVKDSLYHLELGGKSFFFLAGDAQPKLDFNGLNTVLHYEFSRKLVEFFKRVGVKEIYSLAGIEVGEDRMKNKPGVVVAATSKDILEGFKSLGAKVSGEKGLITGSAGLLLGVGKGEGLEGACLMGETSSRVVYSDSEAAKEVLELLKKRFGLDLDLGELGKEAKKVSQTFQEIGREVEEAKKAQKPGPDHSGSLSYVR